MLETRRLFNETEPLRLFRRARKFQETAPITALWGLPDFEVCFEFGSCELEADIGIGLLQWWHARFIVIKVKWF